MAMEEAGDVWGRIVIIGKDGKERKAEMELEDVEGDPYLFGRCAAAAPLPVPSPRLPPLAPRALHHRCHARYYVPRSIVSVSAAAIAAIFTASRGLLAPPVCSMPKPVLQQPEQRRAAALVHHTARRQAAGVLG